MAKKVQISIPGIVTVSLCELLEEKKGLPKFLAFFPEAKDIASMQSIHSASLEQFASSLVLMRQAELEPSKDLVSAFHNEMAIWEEKETALQKLEAKYENQYRDFIPGKTKIITPDMEAQKRALKAKALKAQEQALLNIKFPNRVSVVFPFITVKRNEKLETIYKGLFDMLRDAVSLPLLKGETEGRVDLNDAFQFLPSRVELKKALGFFTAQGQKVALEKLDSDDKALYVNSISFSLYTGDKDTSHIKWRVKTANR